MFCSLRAEKYRMTDTHPPAYAPTRTYVVQTDHYLIYAGQDFKKANQLPGFLTTWEDGRCLEDHERESITTTPRKNNFSKNGIPSCQEFYDRWNHLAADHQGIAKMIRLTASRKTKILLRLKEDDWWESFLSAVRLLPLPGDGWQPNCDWFIRNSDNVYLVLEGKYDWRSDTSSSRKLRQRRNEVAAQERETRIAERKKECRIESAETRKAIKDILNPTPGRPVAQKDVGLLFG